MADRIKGITIEIGGDTSSLSKAISGVNKELKSTQDQLRDVERLLKFDPGNTQLLEQQQRLLAQSISETSRKLEILKNAEDQTQKKFKEGKVSREQYDALTREVIETENALKRLTKRADENADAMKNAGEVVKDTTEKLDESSQTSFNLGDALYQIADAAGVSVPPALEKTMNMLSGVNTTGLVVTGTIAGIVVGLGKLTIDTAKTAKEIDVLSQRMGMSTKEFQEWDYVLKLTGSSAEEAQGDIAALAEKAKDAAEGSGEAAELFEQLGVSVLNSRRQLKSQNELFTEVISALQKMTNETERNAIASALLSTTGENLGPILNMNKEELKALKEEASELGYVMSEENIQKFSKLGDTMSKFDSTVDAVKNNLALALLPLLTSFLETVAAIPPDVLTTLIKVLTAVVGIIAAVKVVGGISKTIGGITDALTTMNPAMLKTYAIVAGIVALVAALLVLIAALSGKKNDIKEITSDVKGLQDQFRNPNLKVPAYATGTPFHPGGLALVGERGPELVKLPRGSSVYTHSETERILSGGGDTYYITVEARNIKELDDLVWMAKNARRDRRSK